jgi:hypothetical protein
MPIIYNKNIIWIKKSESFNNTTKNKKNNNIEIGLPFIRASYNKNDSEIAIFNKMALEARQIKKTYESFINNK